MSAARAEGLSGNTLARAVQKAWRRYYRHIDIVPHNAFTGALEFAERSANQHFLEWGKDRDGRETNFSRAVREMEAHETLTHHTGSHRARITYIADGFAHLGLSTTQKNLLSGSNALDAMYEALITHDDAQNLRSFRRVKEGVRIPAKPGHDIEGAIMTLVRYKEYAYARRKAWGGTGELTFEEEDEALQIAAAAALLIMQHGDPTRYIDGLKGREKAYRKETQYGDIWVIEPRPMTEIIESYEARRLDLRTLSVSEMFGILEHEWQKGKVPEEFRELFPLFQQHYAQEIRELRDFRSIRLQDFLWNFTEEQSLTVAEIFIRADLGDMIYPYQERIARSIRTMGGVRPFYPSGAISPEKLLYEAQFGEGNDENLPQDERSHLRRLLWECFHPDPYPEHALLQQPFIKQTYAEIAIRSAIELQRVGREMMRGNETTVFDESYLSRVNDQAELYVVRAREQNDITVQQAEEIVTQMHRVDLQLPSYAQTIGEAIVGSRRDIKQNKLQTDFLQRITRIMQERQELIDILLADKKRHLYPDYVDEFTELMDSAIGLLTQKYSSQGVTPELVAQWKRESEEGNISKPPLFKKRYDPGNGPRGFEKDGLLRG